MSKDSTVLSLVVLWVLLALVLFIAFIQPIQFAGFIAAIFFVIAAAYLVTAPLFALWSYYHDDK